jgi:hypothetical protein
MAVEFNKMGINVASGFAYSAEAPLDARIVVDTISDRDDHLTNKRAYEGMLVYVKADQKTYQLVGGAWEEFGFNEEKFQEGIAPLTKADEALAKRVETLEGFISGDEGTGLDALVADINANKEAIATNAQAIATETTARTNADATLQKAIDALDTAYKNADANLNQAISTINTNIADLPEIRENIANNASAITAEVQARTTAVATVSKAVETEATRAQGAEAELQANIDEVEQYAGQVLTDAKADAKTKADSALASAKSYTDSAIKTANANIEELAGRVSTNETALGTVDDRIATAKSGAIADAKTYTDGQITTVNKAIETAKTEAINSANATAEDKVGALKTTLEASIATTNSNVSAVAKRVETNETDISNLKASLSNKNSNTIVVSTEDEIATANANPKVGDLAFVVNSKRVYIYKGADTKAVASGWVVIDEITNTMDLQDYLTIASAKSTYRRLDTAIAKTDLADALKTEIEGKANTSDVNTALDLKANKADVEKSIKDAQTALESSINAVAGDLATEVADIKSEITRVEGVVANNLTTVNTTINNLSKELKAEDTALGERIDKITTTLAETEPTNTNVGHVWLQIITD